MKYLIVGGSRDGEWTDIDPRYKRMQMMDREALVILPSAEPIGPVRIKQTTYTIRNWHSQGEDWFLWGEVDLSDADIFNQLLHNYRPR